MDVGQPPHPVDRRLLARRWTQSRRDDLFVCPPAVADYIGAYVGARGRPIHTIVDLWGGSGVLLPAIAELLSPAHAVAVVSDPQPRRIAEALHPGVAIRWWEGTPAAFLDATSRVPDVVIGVPPWGWRPGPVTVEGETGPVPLTEDPSIVVLLRACLRLPPDGVGLFVLSPGFLMRPGPGTAMANLSQLGVHLESVTMLPRGMFSPDSGTGRVLVGLTRQPVREVLAGSLRPDGGEDSGLVGRLAERTPGRGPARKAL